MDPKFGLVDEEYRFWLPSSLRMYLLGIELWLLSIQPPNKEPLGCIPFVYQETDIHPYTLFDSNCSFSVVITSLTALWRMDAKLGHLSARFLSQIHFFQPFPHHFSYPFPQPSQQVFPTFPQHLPRFLSVENPRFLDYFQGPGVNIGRQPIVVGSRRFPTWPTGGTVEIWQDFMALLIFDISMNIIS